LLGAEALREFCVGPLRRTAYTPEFRKREPNKNAAAAGAPCHRAARAVPVVTWRDGAISARNNQSISAPPKCSLILGDLLTRREKTEPKTMISRWRTVVVRLGFQPFAVRAFCRTWDLALTVESERSPRRGPSMAACGLCRPPQIPFATRLRWASIAICMNSHSSADQIAGRSPCAGVAVQLHRVVPPRQNLFLKQRSRSAKPLHPRPRRAQIEVRLDNIQSRRSHGRISGLITERRPLLPQTANGASPWTVGLFTLKPL